MSFLPDSVLIFGPTGAGKTPLGELIEERGLYSRRCHHLDFGQELRTLAFQKTPPSVFSNSDIEFIHDVLNKGLLLENEHFHIAEKIIYSFLERVCFNKDNLLVLNGIPRHVDQAEDTGNILNINELIVLNCRAHDVYSRIKNNTGGDRIDRIDDEIHMIDMKLKTFTDRTTPLIEYYQSNGKSVYHFHVLTDTTTEDIYNEFVAGYR